MVASSDAGGVSMRYTYDGRGRVAELLDAGGGAVSYEYNSFHQLTSITDQLGRSINAEYDRAGPVPGTSYVDPRPERPSVPGLAELGADVPTDVEALVAGGTGVVRRSESPDGLVTTWTLVTGATVELERDADGFAALLTSPGFLRRWTRDECGRILTVTDDVDGAVHVTALERDGAGRIVRQDVDGAVTRLVYGPAGELIARSGPAAMPAGSTTSSVACAGRRPRSSSASSATTPLTSSSSWSRRRPVAHPRHDGTSTTIVVAVSVPAGRAT